MGKNKIRKFKENLTFKHLFQQSFDELIAGFPLKGNWHKEYFANDNPIVLELGCGKGEYTVGLAKRYPDKNFIGLDIKGSRMWVGCKQVEESGLKNVAFIRARISLIRYFFGKDEVSEIWLTFSDPHPRKSKENKRLSSPEFLERYSHFLRDDNTIHMKTDNRQLFDFTLDVIEKGGHKKGFVSFDVYGKGALPEVMEIQTYYEEIWRKEGRMIHYLNFRMNKA